MKARVHIQIWSMVLVIFFIAILPNQLSLLCIGHWLLSWTSVQQHYLSNKHFVLMSSLIKNVWEVTHHLPPLTSPPHLHLFLILFNGVRTLPAIQIWRYEHLRFFIPSWASKSFKFFLWNVSSSTALLKLLCSVAHPFHTWDEFCYPHLSGRLRQFSDILRYIKSTLSVISWVLCQNSGSVWDQNSGSANNVK